MGVQNSHRPNTLLIDIGKETFTCIRNDWRKVNKHVSGRFPTTPICLKLMEDWKTCDLQRQGVPEHSFWAIDSDA